MAAEEERTGFEWMDATLAWLIAPCNVTRLLTTVWGAVCICGFFGDILIYLKGPPDLSSPFMPMYRSGLAFCWLDKNPAPGFLLSLAIWMQFVSGAVLVWIRPWLGFLLCALGWSSLWGSSFIHLHLEYKSLGLHRPSGLGWEWLLPCLWLLVAACGGGRRRSPLLPKVDVQVKT